MTARAEDHDEAPWGRVALRHPRRSGRTAIPSPTPIAVAAAVAVAVAVMGAVWVRLGDDAAPTAAHTGFAVLARPAGPADGWVPGPDAPAGAEPIRDARLAYAAGPVTVHVHRGRGEHQDDVCMIVSPGPGDRELCAPFADHGGAQLYATRTVGAGGADDVVVALVPDTVDRVVVGATELVPEDNVVVVRRPGAFDDDVRLFSGADPVQVVSHLRYERPGGV